MNKSFLNHERPLLTSMVPAHTPDRAIELIKRSILDGADAFGVQPCHFKWEDRTYETYKRIFDSTEGRPTYVTNYRVGSNEGLADDALAEGLVDLASAGATLCDVMGDCFDKHPDELTDRPEAIKKQMLLIDRLHNMGAEVLISSHVLKFTKAERVLEIALAHQNRGADISKIVVHADNMEQQMENIRITALLKSELKIPFLFLSGGECYLHRRFGPMLGNCMVLCVQEYDDLSTMTQPELLKMATILRNF